jgi:TonB-dependent SusC/RagA subfamily outer membrane receptor
MKYIAALVLCMILGIHEAGAQKKKDELIRVEGTVTAFRNLYVKNVEVTARKTKTKALTDTLGYFEIMAREGDVLIFKAAGFLDNRRKVNADRDSIAVNMVMKSEEKDRMVAVGYGHISEKDLTHASNHYENLNNDYLKYNNIAALLRAEIPGARINDQDGVRVFLRGSENVLNMQSSANRGDALLVVDGIIYDNIDFLNIEDIQSVSVLKGPEAAIYGTRGANGVVLISTFK